MPDVTTPRGLNSSSSSRRIAFASAGLLAAAIAPANAAGVTLYDPSLNTLPATQSWTYLALGSASQNISGSYLSFSTSLSNAVQAGFARTDYSFDDSTGATLEFDLAVLTESHANNNRAGFSVIFLDQQKTGIELGFWTNAIWAQSGASFTQAESISTDTTLMNHYALTLLNSNYSLQKNGSTVLSGSLRDYSSAGLPYNTPNFIFLGDDTSSAKASISLGAVSLTSPLPVPEPESFALMMAGLLFQFLGAYSRRKSRQAV